LLETHVLRAGILLCYVGGHVSDKKQKRSERQAQREALRKWRQHEPLTEEEYKLLRKKGYFGSGAKPKTLRGGARSSPAG
jgi:hypothetical protein